MQRVGHHLEPQGSRTKLAAVRRDLFITIGLTFNIHRVVASSQGSKGMTMTLETQHKKALRQEWRFLRDRVSVAERTRASESLFQNIADFAPWRNATIVASFMAMGSEIDLKTIDKLARKSGKQIVYPRVCNADTMTFHLWQPTDPLITSKLGVKEPVSSAPLVDLDAIDFFWVPLLACDDSGNRLGYGGGFYDRLLSNSTNFACGVGYSWQRCRSLPSERHDQRVAGYLSEKKFERFND